MKTIFTFLLSAFALALAAKPVIILKFDDFGERAYRKNGLHPNWKKVIDYLDEKKIKFTLGVFGESLEDSNNNPAYFDWIKSRNADGSIEFWCHGYSQNRKKLPPDQVKVDKKGRKITYEPGEFERSYEEQKAILDKCQALAKRKLGFPFRSFGAHWSGWNQDTAKALASIPEFTSWMYANPELYEDTFKGHIYPRYMAFEYSTFLPNFEKFKAQLAQHQDKDVLVLQGHPGSWFWHKTPPLDQRWQEAKKILDYLVAENYQFETQSSYLAKMPADKKKINKSNRSELYPENWTPEFVNDKGFGVYDFSYAGYGYGEKPLPVNDKIDFDVTKAPFNADNTGKKDATAAIQKALDAAGAKGGGVVFLPEGIYRITIPEDAKQALWIKHSNVVLKGAGMGKTKLFLDQDNSRWKSLILAKPENQVWIFWEAGDKSEVTSDLLRPTRVIPVADASIFKPGDLVALKNRVTDDFIAEHGMTGKWKTTQRAMRGIVLLRRITAVDKAKKTVTIDIPTFYEMKKRDGIVICKLSNELLQNVGIGDLSIGMRENPRVIDWNEKDPIRNDQADPKNAAYDLHFSTGILMSNCENSYIRRVSSFKPEGNKKIHLHSHGIRVDYSRLITVADCEMANPAIRTGGGNGYLFTLNCGDSVFRDCRATNGRHNYDFQNMNTNGNVVLRCYAKDGAIPSDFHMYLSTGNLIDNAICDGDFWECRYRPYGGTPMHGMSGAGNIFWNIEGLRYPSERQKFIVHSDQARLGMVIGTRGPAYKVRWHNMKKGNEHREFIGKGDKLEPQSLYLDQLKNRLAKEGKTVPAELLKQDK